MSKIKQNKQTNITEDTGNVEIALHNISAFIFDYSFYF